MTAADARPRPSKADLVHRRLKEEIELGELAPGHAAVGAVAGRAHRRVPHAGPGGAAPAGRRGAGRPGAAAGRPGVPGVAAERPRPVRLPRAARAGRRSGRRPRPRPPTRSCAARSRRCAPSSPASSARPPSQARSRAFYELADRFDWAIIGATRNEHLRRTIAELRPHTARLRNLSHVDPQRVDVSVAEHLVICDALLRGDADEAAARTAEHLAQQPRDDLPQPGPGARRAASTCSAEARAAYGPSGAQCGAFTARTGQLASSRIRCAWLPVISLPVGVRRRRPMTIRLAFTRSAASTSSSDASWPRTSWSIS